MGTPSEPTFGLAGDCGSSKAGKLRGNVFRSVFKGFWVVTKGILKVFWVIVKVALKILWGIVKIFFKILSCFRLGWTPLR